MEKAFITIEESNPTQRFLRPLSLAILVQRRTPQNSANKEFPRGKESTKAKTNSPELFLNKPLKPDELELETKDPSTLHINQPWEGRFY